MGGLESFLQVIKSHPDNAQCLGEAMAAITNLVHNDDVVKKLHKLGGVDLVVQSLLKHPEFTESSVHGMRLLGKCIEHNFNAKELIELRGVEACLGAMKAHRGVEAIAQGGLFALQAMAEGGQEASQLVGKHGGIDVALDNIKNFKDNPKIVLSGLKLLGALASSKENATKMQALNAVPICVEAMYVFTFSMTLFP